MSLKMLEDRRRSPMLSPPATEFPYPKPGVEKSESEDILRVSRAKHKESDQAKTVTRARCRRSDPPRPDLGLRRAVTEGPNQMGQRASIFGVRRRGTGEDAIKKTPSEKEAADENSISSSSAASSDESESLRTSLSQRDYQNTSMSCLNRVHRHNRRRTGVRCQSGPISRGGSSKEPTGKNRLDGRLAITVKETVNSGYLAKALGPTLQRHVRLLHKGRKADGDVPPKSKPCIATSEHGIPRMNIVIMVIGSRGDIQPFLKIGRILKEKHGHRVRIATHPTFKDFIQNDIGLEFFSVGGDPSELMAFMVKNPGLIPSMEAVRAGEIGRRRESMYEMFQGFWHACVNATDDEKDVSNLKMMGSRHPFIADAIIANPPSFAHFHCAERLAIPLHLMFTFPYSPTQQFPHPLANIKAGNVDTNYINFMSYPLVELMTWQGLGDLVNRFRVKTLGLEPMSTLWAPGQLFRLKVPHTYLWSPGLVPKPADWGPEIDIAGFVFVDLASNYEPPEQLVKFLDAGEAPIYIGFGSISGVEDPESFTRLVFDAVAKTGVRALISKGWGDMGKGMDVPEHVFLLDNVPHDWLFPKVRAVIHHGGAGTTAIGLKSGKPTMIVPFFGDQPFWGEMVAKAGAGAEQCLPLTKLTIDSFAEGIRQCLTEGARQRAEKIAESIEREGDGAENAVDSFHRASMLDSEHSLRCSVFSDRVAVWKYKNTPLRLSALAASLLIESGRTDPCELRLLRHRDWYDFQGPGEPITGAAGTLISGFGEFIGGLSSIRRRTTKGLKYREKEKRRKKRRTVENAVAIPGHMAQQRVNLLVPPVERMGNLAPEMEEVNLHGDAAPPAKRWRSIALKSTTKPPALGVNGDMSALVRQGSNQTPDPPSVPVTIMQATAQGLGHSSKALLQLPVDFWYALALGFHNAPRLYGDGSVRPARHMIVGFRSGLKAAGSGFAYGFLDGVTGLVRLPRQDVHEAGSFGLLTGIGKGIGGIFLKPASGVVGLGGYTFKGIETGVRKRVRDTGKTERWIRHVRLRQGEQDMRQLNEQRSEPGQDGGVEEARSQVLHAWSRQAWYHEQPAGQGRE